MRPNIEYGHLLPDDPPKNDGKWPFILMLAIVALLVGLAVRALGVGPL